MFKRPRDKETGKYDLFSQNIILFRETGLKGGVTATAKLPKWTVETPRGVQLIFRSPSRLGRWVAPPTSTGPSPPLHLTLQHRAGQLMLLPPEWAPWRTRQWQSEADKRAALEYKQGKKKCRRAQNTHYRPAQCWYDRDSSPIVTDWVNISSNCRRDSHLTALRLQVYAQLLWRQILTIVQRGFTRPESVFLSQLRHYSGK